MFSLQGPAAWHRLTVSLAIYATFFKCHDVLRKRPRLVREDVVDLPQLLVQRGGSGLRGRVLLRVIHLQVPVYKIALAQTNYFDTKWNKINFLTPSCISCFKIITYYQAQGTVFSRTQIAYIAQELKTKQLHLPAHYRVPSPPHRPLKLMSDNTAQLQHHHSNWGKAFTALSSQKY